MTVTGVLRKAYPGADIHWVTRSDMADMLHTDPDINRVWAFDKREGFRGLWKLAGKLKREQFDVVYDAHQNLRSAVLCHVLTPWWRILLNRSPRLLVRRKMRLRRLLFFKFKFRSLIPMPFKGAESFVSPVVKGLQLKQDSEPCHKEWRFPSALQETVNDLLKGFSSPETITLIPSAAWPLKRWPVDYWKELVGSLPHCKFLILGGPADDFCEEIAAANPGICLNLAGKTSLMDSFYIVSQSALVISGDTGFLHAADLFGVRGIALIGPAAFGYPSGNSIEVIERSLSCKPCSKAGEKPCTNKEYQACLRQISPAEVAVKTRQALGGEKPYVNIKERDHFEN